jgi:hypothetical protein
MQRKTLPAFRTIAFISGLLMLGSAQAHHVWLEQDAQGAKLYFGEFGENLLELMHRDNAGGERKAADGQSDRYDRASYVTSLTVLQPEGLPALPASAAQPPNKAN